MNYMHRIDFASVLNKLSDNLTDQVSIMSATPPITLEYLIDNLEMFFDESFVEDMYYEFNISLPTVLNSVRNRLLDHRGENGGTNIARLNIAEMTNNLRLYFTETLFSDYSLFNQYEQAHFSILFDMILNPVLSANDIVAHINNTSGNRDFTLKYQTILYTTANALNFYSSDAFDFNISNPNLLAGLELSLLIGGSILLDCDEDDCGGKELLIIGTILVILVCALIAVCIYLAS
jgi:hypothetical protein